MMAATPNLVTAITNGWASFKATLVAVEAEDHSIAKSKPISNHLYFVCMDRKINVPFISIKTTTINKTVHSPVNKLI